MRRSKRQVGVGEGKESSLAHLYLGAGRTSTAFTRSCSSCRHARAIAERGRARSRAIVPSTAASPPTRAWPANSVPLRFEPPQTCFVQRSGSASPPSALSPLTAICDWKWKKPALASGLVYSGLPAT